MTIEIERAGEVLVLSPVGRLDSNNAGEAEKTILGKIAEGEMKIVFDFGRLDYISSAGLRVMLMAAKRLKQGGGKMVLCAMRDHIREVFEISGFLSILTVCPTRDEALTQVG
ncbi:MAG: STAS domain-containing protein [Alphaproteobacteria bacterium]|nr:STAS domain-containing protein [Alphaproteobacteria bacterium]